MNVPNNKLDFELNSRILKNRKLAILNLRGYFDGDGCISFSSGTRRFSPNPIKINYYPLIDWPSESKAVVLQIKEVLTKLRLHPFILKHFEKKGGRMGYVVRVGGRMDYEKFINIIGSNNPVQLTKILIYEIFGHSPPKTTLKQRIEILNRIKSPEEFYKIRPNKIRPIIMKENEEKVLKVLFKKSAYYNEIMRETGIKDISAVLRRLENFNQIKCIGFKKEGHLKKFYEITEVGRKRLNRILEILKKLKVQFCFKLSKNFNLQFQEQ